MTPPRAGYEASYSRSADGWDPHIAHFTTFGARLVELADPRPGERVLDVGAGRGACLFPAAGRVGPQGRVDGVDLAERMVECLAADIAERGVRNATARRMDAQALTVPDASYDVVTCAFTLFILPDPAAAAAGFLRALRPGGRCAVSVPDGPLRPAGLWDVERLYHSYARRLLDGSAPVLMPDFDLDPAALLADAGFTRVEAAEEVREFVFPSVDAWWEWTWTVNVRAFYERLPPPLLEEMRREAFAMLAPLVPDEGLPAVAGARFATAVRPPAPGSPRRM
ncbi:class I SAM-dependent methyltransferase [Streptomonospora nanhaiensis]|uniref:O-methyltransferase/aklanonic acid methyltransferase n=1 Tax=Streptomonospora nanhaiensis TaxID=1323731 RepID=A0A853BUF6_9ACTN|nr:methyltransferase domain-containing protein [Streptomonospora nanhaiensis]MBX9389733.1 methyltransferase domain-containing protein [Streptomonospora nanhaiensis]NYI98396.1 O-methyltransferase/aklanonic acid methyltransferase [Streptomonospora nanhaiensis]